MGTLGRPMLRRLPDSNCYYGVYAVYGRAARAAVRLGNFLKMLETVAGSLAALTLLFFFVPSVRDHRARV